MSILELGFESKEDSLSVRRFAVHEAMSSLFSISVWARSPNDDIDLESIVGRPASFKAVSGMKYAARGRRTWSGVCSHMELIHAETTGLSTYYLRIVPKLWLLTQRTNHRIFQHKSLHEIVDQILGEWSIERDFRIDKEAYPKLELRAQYGESDFDFVNRLLEEGGISYSFEEQEERGSSISRMVMNDAPTRNEPREGGAIGYVDNPNQAAEKEFLSSVRLSQQVRPGRVSLRDFDFRRQPRFKFFGDAGLGKGIEDKLEIYRYEPASFLVEFDEKSQGPWGLKNIAGELLSKLPGAQAVQAAAKLGEAAAKVGEAAKAVTGAAGALAGKAGEAVEGAAGKAGGALGGAAGKAGVQALVGGASPGAAASQAVKAGVAGAVDKAVGAVENKISGALGETGAKIAGAAMGALGGQLGGQLGGMLGGLIGRFAGDDKGFARFSEKAGVERAHKQLEAMRATRRNISFESNVMDLAPGTIMSIGQHSRSDLKSDQKLMVTESSLEGTHDGEWSMSHSAMFADLPYRPPMKTGKPVIQGMQSALVVGPAGEEIYTDEHGRVRVQFHWDREGGHNDNSFCWVRVSQGWAGSGFGMIALPRVGQEVLVAFLEGNPDHPVVVGRLFNATSPVPYDLPANKTKSGWKSDSTPGSGGYNEISFEDAKGRELVYVQAERDLEKLVKRNEAIAVGNDRRTDIAAVDESHIGVRYNVTMKPGEAGGEGGNGEKTGPTFYEMVDKRIHLTTGEASITLDGPNITMQAKGRIFIHSTDNDVEILGGPWVKINCGPAGEEGDTVTSHHITGIVRDQDGEPVKDMKVVVKASDGSIQQVATDGSGRYFALVPEGKCEVSLPGGLRFGNKCESWDLMDSTPIVFDDSGPAV